MAQNSVSVSDPSGGRRFSELDAIRGLACLQVIFLHFRDMWIDESKLTPFGHRVAKLLHPFYDGHEAVILFFLLSGFVLALPYINKRQQPYKTYAVRRILRIYGPYLGALALALAGDALLHSRPAQGIWDFPFWRNPLNLASIAKHIGFIGHYETREYDFVIWSLVQEMRISLIFPLLALGVLRLGAKLSFLTAVVSSMVAIYISRGYSPNDADSSFAMMFHYLAFFIVGIILAMNLKPIQALWKKTATGWRWVFLAGTILFYTKDIKLFSLVGSACRTLTHRTLPDFTFTPGTNWMTLVGACGLVVISLQASTVSRWLRSKPFQFFGRISYSLYLVHPIVLLTLARYFERRLSLWSQFFLYTVGAISIAWLFCVTVEEPFIGWSRSISATRRARTPAQLVPPAPAPPAGTYPA